MRRLPERSARPHIDLRPVRMRMEDVAEGVTLAGHDGPRRRTNLVNVGFSHARKSTMGRGCVKTHRHFDFGGLPTLPSPKIIEYTAF